MQKRERRAVPTSASCKYTWQLAKHVQSVLLLLGSYAKKEKERLYNKCFLLIHIAALLSVSVTAMGKCAIERKRRTVFTSTSCQYI